MKLIGRTENQKNVYAMDWKTVTVNNYVYDPWRIIRAILNKQIILNNEGIKWTKYFLTNYKRFDLIKYFNR